MRARTVALRSAAPAFLVSDVSQTMRWYRSVLGFDTYPFPKTPPHVFGILAKGGVEIMLQRLEGYEKPRLYAKRAGGVWNAYIRISGVTALYRRLRRRRDVEFLEPLCEQPYGDTEFAIADPNGYVLVFSELIRKPAKRRSSRRGD